MKKILLEIIDYVIIILVVVLFRTYIATPAVVDGASMDTTLADGQIVIINKINYKLNDVKRYDIVVLKNDEDHDKIIKRVIALPNETIEYKKNKLYINGIEVEPPFKFEKTDDFYYATSKGEYFVLGDNRDVSKDSRYLGNFTKDDIIGKVNFRIYPFDKFGKIEKIND